MQSNRRRARPRSGLVLAISIGYLGVWLLLDRLSAFYGIAPEISVWYPPTGLSVALLLVFGLRFSPLLVVAALLESLTGASEVSLATNLWLSVIDAAGFGAAVWLALGPLGVDPRLPRQHDVVVFVWLLCIALPLLTGAASVLLLFVVDTDLQEGIISTTLATAAGNANGVAALTPAILVVLRAFPGLWRTHAGQPLELDVPRGREWYEVAGVFVLLALALFGAYGPAFGGPLETVYVAWIPMLYVAARHGIYRTSLFLLLLNAGAVALAVRRLQGDNQFNLQFGLLTVTVAGLLLAALVTERRTHAEQLRHDALHDPLTGLPNRTLLTDRIIGAIKRLDRHTDAVFAVLYVDLDRFKTINDTLGHGVGDDVLRAVGERLREAVRPADTIARVGGDEFVVLVEQIRDEHDAQVVADRVLEALDRPLVAGEREFTIGATMGLTMAADDATPEELLRDSDIALNRAKATQRGRVLSFSEPMRSRAVEALALEHDLRRALDGDELDIALQPILSSTHGRVISMEALARWQHRERGPVDSATFVRVAEEAGLVHALAGQVLRRACAAVAALPSPPSGAPPRVAVNVSALQLERASFADDVRRALERSGLPAERLELELTESAWVTRAVHAARQLRELHAEGVRFVIDDFGSGYSSFAYLRRLPVSGLKLDHEFVAGLPDDRDATVIAEAVVAMAQGLSLSVTAEGVEDTVQLEYLRDIGCERVQGRLMAPEMRVDELSSWLEDAWRPDRQRS